MKQDILKGNFKVSQPVQVDTPWQEEESLTEKMQSAAARVLGGSACYVKKVPSVYPPKPEEGES